MLITFVFSIPVHRMEHESTEAHFEAHKSTMFVITEVNSGMWNFLQGRNCFELSRNSWFITLFNNQSNSQTNAQYLETKIRSWTSLCFDSRIYILVVVGNSSKDTQTSQLFEAYRIGTTDLVIRQLAALTNGSFIFSDFTFIWERRRDLKGHTFNIVALEGIPFTELNTATNVNQ